MLDKVGHLPYSALMAKPLTPEQVARRRENARNRKLTPEQKARRKAARAAREKDPKVRAKKAEAFRAWREENPDKVWRSRNTPAYKEKQRVVNKAYKIAHRAEFLVYQQQSRTKWLGAAGMDLTRVREFLTARHCWYCDARDVDITIDHLTPVSRGGTHANNNIVPACRSCNSRKGNKTLEEYAIWLGKVRR